MALLKIAAIAAGLIFTGVKAQRFECDPCIQRKNFRIEGIFHGEIADAFWQQVQAAAVQSASDMGVELGITLYETFSPEAMAADIRAAAAKTDKPDALIVTIPADSVEPAIQEAVAAGIPVFGFNSGYKVASDLGIIAFVAQDEYIAGVAAADEFLRKLASESVNLTSALFINHEKGNTGLEDRLNGFRDTIQSKTNITAVELVVDGALDDTALVELIRPQFVGCPWDIVLLASARTIDLVLTAFDGLFADCTGKTFLGTFDTNTRVYGGIVDGKVAFGISQQQYLQGILPVVLAAIFVSTGKIPATPQEGDYGIYLSGPSIVNSDNVPNDAAQICGDDAYPICPNTESLAGGTSQCACTDKPKIRIAGVLHGVTTDSFWDPVFAAARQAATDMNVTLDLSRFEPQETDEVLHLRMAAKIEALCKEGVEGLFVTIPSDTVVDAIKGCQALNIPVISVNAGAEVAAELGLMHHIGQLEFNSGYSAGKQLIEAGATQVWCLNHEPGTSTITERCNGLATAANETANVEYKGQIVVPRDNDVRYRVDVELAIDDQGDWDGIGLLLAGQIQVVPAITLLGDHPKAILGSFDLSDAVYAALDSEEILFGIDQQPYLQGYLPIPLLTFFAYSDQKLANKVIESGPSFIKVSPAEDQQVCERNFYEVCPDDYVPPPPPTAAPISAGAMATPFLALLGTFLVHTLLLA